MEKKTTQGTKTTNLKALETHRDMLKKQYESLLQEIEMTKQISTLYDVIKTTQDELKEVTKIAMAKRRDFIGNNKVEFTEEELAQEYIKELRNILGMF